MTRFLRTTLFALGLSICAAAPSDADARGFSSAARAMRAIPSVARAVKVYGRQSDGSHVLTVSELSACLQSQRDLQSQSRRLDAEQTGLEAANDEVQSLGVRMDLLEAAGDYDAYNDLVPRFNSKLTTLQGRVASFDRDLNAYNAKVERFNSGCAGRSYYESDVLAAGVR